MTNPGLLTYLLPLIGIRSASAFHEVMETIEVFRALGNCYRLACSQGGPGLSYARLTLDFVKTTIVSAYPALARRFAGGSFDRDDQPRISTHDFAFNSRYTRPADRGDWL
jgi:hypothetical protein